MLIHVIAIGLVFLVLLCILCIYMYKQAQLIDLRKEELYLPDWPEGFDGARFLFITDLHRTRLPEPIKEALKNEKIDLVLIGGDITERRVSLNQVRENVRFLSSLAPAYFVWGNHDYQADFRQLEIVLREEKVTILDNRSVSFESGNDRLWLIGVDEVSLRRDQLELALLDITESGYRLLLSHNPNIMKKLKDADGIKGVLSGHTHGGQICLPFIGPPIKYVYPGFPEHYSGLYQLHNGKLAVFVSNGVGTSRLPFRLMADAEIHLFTMKAKKKTL